MTTIIVSTANSTLDGEGSTNNATFNASDVIDPITGALGIKTVRLANSSATYTATFTWTPQDVTYAFADVAYTTTSVDGADAVINVLATYSGYEITIVDGGVGYAVTDVLGVSGDEVGGSSTANDILITVTAVDLDGAITGFTLSGTPLWPQSVIGQLQVLPRSENYVQVTNTPGIGCYFTGFNTDGKMYITPATIVG
jgi:hypothetical protein